MLFEVMSSPILKIDWIIREIGSILCVQDLCLISDRDSDRVDFNRIYVHVNKKNDLFISLL